MAGLLLTDLFYSGYLTHVNHKKWDIMGVMTCLAMITIKFFALPEFILPFLIILFYLSSFRGVMLNKFFTTKCIFIIGGMCYTIYLYHGTLCILLAHITKILYITSLPLFANGIISIMLHGAITAIICCVIFQYTERPFMNKYWPQNLWSWLKHKLT